MTPKRYRDREEFVTTMVVEMFVCPECGFEFNAFHTVDDVEGGWECPLCENDKKEYDIEFYWSMFHEIERIRLNPDTSDDEKWEKIGELIASILQPKDFS